MLLDPRFHHSCPLDILAGADGVQQHLEYSTLAPPDLSLHVISLKDHETVFFRESVDIPLRAPCRVFGQPFPGWCSTEAKPGMSWWASQGRWCLVGDSNFLGQLACPDGSHLPLLHWCLWQACKKTQANPLWGGCSNLTGTEKCELKDPQKTQGTAAYVRSN